jgi:glycosyltransferase involved in cell wall biosynthesis
MKKTKVLFVANTPFGMSSYGVVAKNMIKAMPEVSWYVLSRQWKEPIMAFKSGNVPYMLLPSQENDPYCFESFLRYVELLDPDYLITIGDIGIQYGYAHKIHSQWKGKKIKWFAYTPIDTDWIGKDLVDQLKHTAEFATIVAMSKFGQEELKKYGIEAEMVYHGVDTSVFYKLPLTERTELRKKMGLQGKFVVFTNSNNQQRKQLPALLEAFKLANIDNKFLLLHTDLISTSEYGGYELKDFAELFGIQKQCSMTQSNQYPGWRIEFSDKRMNELYNIADAFIFNGNEGFGLPVLEAQAALTPVFAGNNTTMPELVPKENLIEIDHTEFAVRTKYGSILPSDMAKKLETLANTGTQIKIINVEDFTWEKVCEEWKKLMNLSK